jgi:hypothetical protein
VTPFPSFLPSIINFISSKDCRWIAFQLKFSTEAGYRSLMNVCKAGFNSVKFETVRYSLTVNFSSQNVEKTKVEYQKLISSVKCKSKQISLIFKNVDQLSLISYFADVYEGIYKLSIANALNSSSLPSDFNFTAFRNICYLVLMGIDGILTLPSGFENVEKLELHSCGFTEIENINPTETLNELKISRCKSLVALPSLSGINKLSIDWLPLSDLDISSSCTTLEFRTQLVISAQFLQRLSSPKLYLATIQVLKLSCFFPEEFENFNFIANIPVVELSHESPELHTLGSIPVFNGIELSLSNMGCFSIWNKQSTLLPNIRKLCLLYCDHLISLPEMPRVKSVGIKHCSHLQCIPCLNSLTYLKIFNFAQPLKLPAEFPKLQYLSIVNCKNWLGCAFAHRLCRWAYLCFTPISDLSPLKNTKNLFLLGVNSLTSLQGLEGAETETFSSVNDQRYVCLANLNQMSDFSFCRNIWQLALVQLPHLTNCHGISNIFRLAIKECNYLITTTGLLKIRLGLIIMDCGSLEVLNDVKNIPFVQIQSCPLVANFTGLGNHKLLEVNNMPFFKIIFEEYKKDPTTHQDILENIDKLYYSDETTNIELGLINYRRQEN